LLLLSDGIAEARDADGRLFGFERVAQLLQSHPSTAELASAAQRFGQQDDISVISVTGRRCSIEAVCWVCGFPPISKCEMDGARSDY